MKKIIYLILLSVMLFTISSCKIQNKYETYENGYDITIGEDIKPYLLYPNSMPILHFDMKNVNVGDTKCLNELCRLYNDVLQSTG